LWHGTRDTTARRRGLRRDGGRRIVRHPRAWEPREGESRIGDIVSTLRIAAVEAGVVHGAVDYEVGGRTWTHEFAMRVFADEAELEYALAEGGWRLERRLDRDGGWFVATTG
jgi:hypothetical protein